MDGNKFGIKKNFGFGFMRLPLKDGEIDIEQVKKMVDLFLEAGFNYFDTAHGYHDGKSEWAIKEALTSRYPRDQYILTDKLSPNFFEKKEDIKPLIEEELQAAGVEYFDFLLMHAQSDVLDKKYSESGAYEVAKELKAEGKIRHIGISFHDSPEALRRILTSHPEIEAVQIQFNYLDYDDPGIQSKKVYDVAVEFGKPVIVMEPVKGGRLANLAPEAAKVFEGFPLASPASYALRFAASFPSVMMVLSGMSNLEMVEDNVRTMMDFRPLNVQEEKAVEAARHAIRGLNFIACTSCRYCLEVCPKQLPIPQIISTLNKKRVYASFDRDSYLSKVAVEGHRAGDCLKCGRCEKMCPQHLPIRTILEEAHKELEK